MRQDFEMSFILSLYNRHISFLPVALGFLVKQKTGSLSVSLLPIYKTVVLLLFISFPVGAVQLTDISVLSAPVSVLICHCSCSASSRQLERQVFYTEQCPKRTIWDIFRYYFLLCVIISAMRLLTNFFSNWLCFCSEDCSLGALTINFCVH